MVPSVPTGRPSKQTATTARSDDEDGEDAAAVPRSVAPPQSQSGEGVPASAVPARPTGGPARLLQELSFRFHSASGPAPGPALGPGGPAPGLPQPGTQPAAYHVDHGTAPAQGETSGSAAAPSIPTVQDLPAPHRHRRFSDSHAVPPGQQPRPSPHPPPPAAASAAPVLGSARLAVSGGSSRRASSSGGVRRSGDGGVPRSGDGGASGDGHIAEAGGAAGGAAAALRRDTLVAEEGGGGGRDGTEPSSSEPHQPQLKQQQQQKQQEQQPTPQQQQPHSQKPQEQQRQEPQESQEPQEPHVAGASSARSSALLQHVPPPPPPPPPQLPEGLASDDSPGQTAASRNHLSAGGVEPGNGDLGVTPDGWARPSRRAAESAGGGGSGIGRGRAGASVGGGGGSGGGGGEPAGGAAAVPDLKPHPPRGLLPFFLHLPVPSRTASSLLPSPRASGGSDAFLITNPIADATASPTADPTAPFRGRSPGPWPSPSHTPGSSPSRALSPFVRSTAPSPESRFGPSPAHRSTSVTSPGPGPNPSPRTGPGHIFAHRSTSVTSSGPGLSPGTGLSHSPGHRPGTAPSPKHSPRPSPDHHPSPGRSASPGPSPSPARSPSPGIGSSPGPQPSPAPSPSPHPSPHPSRGPSPQPSRGASPSPEPSHRGPDPAPSPSPASSLALQRWQRAVTALSEVSALHRAAGTLADKSATPADRLFAATRLALQQRTWEALLAASAGDPHRQLLRHYLEKRKAGAFASVWERVEAELVISGTVIFDWCTPRCMGEHTPFFTASACALLGGTFLFMAGQYPYAVAAGRRAACQAATGSVAARCWGSAFITAHAGPGYLGAVLKGRPSFSPTFLRAWGGRYAPDLQRGQAYRWFTSQLPHLNSHHLAANLALLAALGGPLERKYGTVRVVAVWTAAVVGGELLSTAVEDPCRMVVGCSGGVFGLLGLFAADVLLNYATMRRPILRCAVAAVLVGLLLYALVAGGQGSISHMSHLGGLLCGLLPALAVLPRLASERWEAAWPALGGFGLLAWLAVLPAWVYAVRLPAAARECSAAP